MPSVFPSWCGEVRDYDDLWRVKDMPNAAGALWRSCLTGTALCHSTWMTWRGRTSASSSASTSWRRGYSRSTRRAVRMSTVRWVSWKQCAMTNECMWKRLEQSTDWKSSGLFCEFVFSMRLSLSFWIQLQLICCISHYSLVYTDTSSWKSALLCNFHCLLTQLSCCLLYRAPVFRHGTAESDYTLTSSCPLMLCTVASLTRSLLRSHLS